MEWIAVDPASMGRVLLATAAVYIAVLVGIRVAGRRTVAEMSAFDFVVTVALGSLVAQTAVAQQSPLRGIVAVAMLLALQLGVGAVRRRWPLFRRLIDFTPQTLVENGEVRSQNMRSPQMTEGDLRAKLRQTGVFSLDDVELAILESSGRLSVLRRSDTTQHAPEAREQERGGGPSR